MKRLVLFTPWFGPWPVWINLYLESCRRNSEVDWLIHTDQDLPENRPDNVHFIPISLTEFCDTISRAIGVPINAPNAYKLNDLKPMLGHAFASEISNYRSFGYADLDVIFGRIRHFYTDDLLDRYDAISGLAGHLSGHLAVFRNSPENRFAYQRGRHWREAASSFYHIGFDEGAFSRVYMSRSWIGQRLRRLKARFENLHPNVDSTVEPPEHHPQVWTWRDGILRSDRNDGQERLYLHFMNWRSDRYRNPSLGRAPWPALNRPLPLIDWRLGARDGFQVSPRGFEPLTADAVD
ncbi:DUF6625 family protein [Devosia sp. Root105]|uniref:DUF6625 family protein n=1 Tax=Devosia sp. Root105 TaxID=1736423 RepID=UPI0006FFA8DC|nr:DUF6625 family protein [Devosia sp. Root105]KQU97358.1 hypothetical protein ASC68_11125 [Devosia sp. Root105]